MARKITELTAAGALNGADLLWLEQSGAARKVTLTTLNTFLTGGGGGGDITKVGTPVDNQVAVWTGDGTLEGASTLTYDGISLGLSVDSTGAGRTYMNLTDSMVTNNGMQVRMVSNSQRLVFAPIKAGTVDFADEFGYDFANSQWYIDDDIEIGGLARFVGGPGQSSIFLNSSSSFVSTTLNLPAQRWQEADGTDVATIRGVVEPGDIKMLEFGTQFFTPKLRLRSNNLHTLTGNLTVTNTLTVNDLATVTRLAITSPNDVTLSSAATDPLLIGSATSSNIGIDSNEIQARNNGVASTLSINILGGLTSFGSGGLQSSGNFNAVGSQFRGTSGAILRLFDGTNTDYIDVDHDGNVGRIRQVGGGGLYLNTAGTDVLQMTGTISQFVNGQLFRILDAGNTDWLQQRHNGTNYLFEPTNTNAIWFTAGTRYVKFVTDGRTFDGGNAEVDLGGLVISNEGMIAGAGIEGAGIDFLKLGSGNTKKAAIVPRQFGGDDDAVGIRFYVSAGGVGADPVVPLMDLVGGTNANQMRLFGGSSFLYARHDGTFGLIGTSAGNIYFQRAGVNSIEIGSTVTRFMQGMALRLDGPTGLAAYADFDHDDTDLRTTFVGTTAWEVDLAGTTDGFAFTTAGAYDFHINKTGQRVDIRNGYDLRIFDSTDTDYINISLDGTDANVDFGGVSNINWGASARFRANGGVDVGQGTNIRNIDTFRLESFYSQRANNPVALGTYPANFGIVYNMGSGSTVNTDSYGLQFFSDYSPDNNGFYMRRGSDNVGSENGAGVWQNWKQIVTKEFMADGINTNLRLTGTSSTFAIPNRTALGTWFDFPGTSVAGIANITNQGGIGMYCDSSMLLHAGDNYGGLLTDLSIGGATADELLYLTADGRVTMIAGRQTSFATSYRAELVGNGEFRQYAQGAVSGNYITHDTATGTQYRTALLGTFTSWRLSSGGGGDMFRIRDSGGAGNAANPWISFRDSADTRLGYVGMGSISDSVLRLVADSGGIEIRGTDIDYWADESPGGVHTFYSATKDIAGQRVQFPSLGGIDVFDPGAPGQTLFTVSTVLAQFGAGLNVIVTAADGIENMTLSHSTDRGIISTNLEGIRIAPNNVNAFEVLPSVIRSNVDHEIRNGEQLRIYGSGNTSRVNITMIENTGNPYLDFAGVGSGTGQMRLWVGSTNLLDLLNGMDLRIRNVGSTDYITINHDGTDARITGVNTRLVRFEDHTQGVAVGNPGSLYLQEQTAARGDFSGWGQLWVRNTTTNNLWFTDDGGNDIPITVLPKDNTLETGTETLAANNRGRVLFKDNATVRILNIPANYSGPDGSSWVVLIGPNGADIDVNVAVGVTLWLFNGTAWIQINNGDFCNLIEGQWTIWHEDDTNFYCSGSTNFSLVA